MNLEHIQVNCRNISWLDWSSPFTTLANTNRYSQTISRVHFDLSGIHPLTSSSIKVLKLVYSLIHPKISFWFSHSTCYIGWKFVVTNLIKQEEENKVNWNRSKSINLRKLQSISALLSFMYQNIHPLPKLKIHKQIVTSPNRTHSKMPDHFTS